MLPLKQIAINLAPADAVNGAFVLGELSLHGNIEPVSGVLTEAAMMTRVGGSEFCRGTGPGGACGCLANISGDGRELLEKAIETQ